MITPEYLLHLYQYSYWANHQVLATAFKLSPEQLYQDQGHSWGTVHGVLLHMSNAEWIWLQRWKGNSPQKMPGVSELPTLDAVQSRWAEIEGDIMGFIASLDSEKLQREVHYTNTSGKNYHLPLWQLMVHVPNHGTHHRGELAAMFAIMKVDHSEDDLLYYFLNLSNQRPL